MKSPPRTRRQGPEAWHVDLSVLLDHTGADQVQHQTNPAADVLSGDIRDGSRTSRHAKQL